MNTKGIVYLFGSSCIFLYVMVFSVSPMMGEDFGLTKRFTNETILERMHWAIERSEFQMTRWNARLGEQVAIFSLSMPSAFMAATSLLCIILLIFALSNMTDSKLNKLDRFFICSCFVFFLMPGFEVFFWKTANAGYLQTITLTMFAIIPFISEHARQVVNKSKLYILLHVVICFLAGMSFENTPVAIIILAFSLLALREVSFKSIIIPVIAILAGWLVLMLSPSTAIRSEHYKAMYHVPDMSVDYFMVRATDVIKVFFSTSSVLFFLALAALGYLFFTKALSKRVACLIFSSVLVVGSMCLSPYTEARAFLYAWCVMIVVVVHAANDIYTKYKNGIFATAAFGFLSLSQLSTAYSTYNDLAFQANQREYTILNNIGQEECKNGVNIFMYKTNSSYKYVNNRDVWFFYNPINGSRFYGCKLLNK